MSKSVAELVEQLFAFDAEQEAVRIGDWMRHELRSSLKRRGLIIAISGGVDSSVCAALAVQALGRERVFGLLMPERDSSSESVTRGRAVADLLQIEYQIQDIAPTLDAIGCYKWRDEAMRQAIPDYTSEWKSKIVISGAAQGQINHFKLVAQGPKGERVDTRLDLKAYLQIVAATNFKQRIRKTMEYFHADRLNYAVIGTPNRLEYDQGFFVKNGDGSADLEPIAHLYKSQIYMLARRLGLPSEICESSPSTDTYSLPQGQDEFYFALPYREMDIALWCRNGGKSADELAGLLGLSTEQAAAIYQDIDSKRRTTRYLHEPPLTVETVLAR